MKPRSVAKDGGTSKAVAAGAGAKSQVKKRADKEAVHPDGAYVVKVIFKTGSVHVSGSLHVFHMASDVFFLPSPTTCHMFLLCATLMMVTRPAGCVWPAVAISVRHATHCCTRCPTIVSTSVPLYHHLPQFRHPV
jgi:hypothetical protein